MALAPKKGIESLWPIKGKRVLLRVDFNVPIKDGVIQNDHRIRSALPTIRKIVDQGGVCVVMSHMGRPTGVPMATEQTHRDALMRTWVSEKGQGKTVFFAVLPSEDKAWILQQVDQKQHTFPSAWNGVPPSVVGNGKTHFFAGLPEDVKTTVLNKWTERSKKQQTDFVYLRKYHGYSDENTLEPVAKRLSELLGKQVKFAPDCLGAQQTVSELQNGDVLLLENVRFYKEENSKKEEDRLRMAEVFATYGDYYVCDAFGTAHRDSATITGIPKVLGHGVAGYLMKKEIDSFAKALTKPARPMAAIVGGSKVSDKIKVLENLVKKVNKLFIGGAMAYVFLKAQGLSIGKSFCEAGQSFTDKYGNEQDSILQMARDLLTKADEYGVQVFLPVDHVCHTEFKQTDTPLITKDANIPDNFMALDIGPQTRDTYVKEILGCSTVVWNGPMGVFEIPAFAMGTFDVAKALAECPGMTIIGGGDSASAAELSGYASQVTHVSTGGGASLELLEGKMLPGISALTDQEEQEATACDGVAESLDELKTEVRALREALAKNSAPQGFSLAEGLPSALLNAAIVCGIMFMIHK
eukprot:Rhum_TRINITY_DN10863_c0_g1::Rhum_TRINITY_DN10863_c0_g1_i1::g.40808::m.40808/K00927/PGK, pgk; phosphoglycerate kinase